MTKKRIIEQLRELRRWLGRLDKNLRYVEITDESFEALDAAIRAVRKQPDLVRLGKKGGEATKKKYGVAHLRRVGKLGGRPRKKRDETKRQ